MHTDRLTQPLRDLSAWTAHFERAEIPVLERTAEAIEALRLNEDAVDANLIGETVAGDPLMTLRMLAHAAAIRPARTMPDRRSSPRYADVMARCRYTNFDRPRPPPARG